MNTRQTYGKNADQGANYHASKNVCPVVLVVRNSCHTNVEGGGHSGGWDKSLQYRAHNDIWHTVVQVHLQTNHERAW